MATVQDPRFKTRAFGNQTNAHEAVASVTTECAGLRRSEDVTPSTSQSTTEEAHHRTLEEAESDKLWELLDCRVPIKEFTTQPKALASPEDQFKYWQSRAAVYLNLYKLDKRYLHMPATSMTCERVFSKGSPAAEPSFLPGVGRRCVSFPTPRPRRMVLSTSQQVALAFTAVLLMFVVLPRLFGVSGGGTVKENTFDPRYSRKGPGPGALRGQPVSVNAPGQSHGPESLQQMKKLMEQELKNDKYKASSNKGYVFTLMPLYAIGVGVFAAYKFLKIKSADDQAQKDSFVKGAKKSVEAENQLNELEQRLAQTEKMLNSILTQLDPLTNCVKSVAREQKDELMSQLQTIRCLMKKRGMKCSPLNITEASCGRNLDDIIVSLGASETSLMEASPLDKQNAADPVCPAASEELEEDAAAEGEKLKELAPEEDDMPSEEDRGQDEEEVEDCELMPSLEESPDRNFEDIGRVETVSGLRRRNRPE